MADDVALIYLEADDEVTSVVRRVRAAAASRVVLVAPGRSRAVSSTVALRLLGRFAAEDGRELAIVGDTLTRSLAADAGIPAYVSIDDARAARPVDATAGVPRRAGIHVVRGTHGDEVAPAVETAVAADPAWAETRASPVPRPHPRAQPARRGARRRAAAALGAIVALLLVAGVVAGAVLLPAATVSLVPRVVEVPARTYTLELAGERDSGTLDEPGTITATGTYPILTQATGTVLLNNFSGAPVSVEAGTLVAVGVEAGAQAFATGATVVVPPGELTPQGTVQAGQAPVPVTAVAPGLGGNVPALAIDTVLSEAPRNSLRGFSNNPEPVVVNPAPTTGGTESTGPMIVQADVGAAVAAVRDGLTAALAEELARGDLVAVPVGAPPEPTIEGADALVGAQDQPTAEIRGTLAYDYQLVDPDAIERAAVQRLAADEGAIPGGHTLVEGRTAVTVAETSATAAGVTAVVEVAGTAQAQVEPGDVVDLVRGRPVEDAERALDDVGRAQIEVWPGWVTSVPDLEWRIDVRIDGGEEGEAASPSGSP